MLRASGSPSSASPAAATKASRSPWLAALSSLVETAKTSRAHFSRMSCCRLSNALGMRCTRSEMGSWLTLARGLCAGEASCEAHASAFDQVRESVRCKHSGV